MFSRVLILALVLATAHAVFADDKAKRDRDAAAALDLQLSLANKPAPVAAPSSTDGVKIMVGYCVGDKCYVVQSLSPDATDKEIHAAFNAAAEKAKAATKADAEPLDAWSITADVDPETGGMFIGADGDTPPAKQWVCGPDGCVLTALPPVKVARPANCTCGETCPCVAAMPSVSAGSPMTMFSSVSYRTIADRPRLFHGQFRFAFGRVLFWRR